jgi:hypothetical protein
LFIFRNAGSGAESRMISSRPRWTPDQRHERLCVAFELHADSDSVVTRDCEMADAQLVQFGCQAQLAQQAAVARVDVGQRRRHGRAVEFGAAGLRLGQDAAIGDDKSRVGKPGEIVRAGTVGGKLAGAAIAVLGIADADDSVTGGDVVLGAEKPAAVGREHAVAEEVSILAGGEIHHRCAVGDVEHDGETAGAASEDDGLVAPRPQGHSMAAIRQRQLEQHFARRLEGGDGKVAVDRGLRAEETGGTLPPRRRSRQAQGRRQGGEKAAPINRHRGC